MKIAAILSLFLCTLAFGKIEPVVTTNHLPVTLKSVKDCVTLVATHSVCRAIQTSPVEYSDAVATYFRELSKVFCDMQKNGNYTPDNLESEVKKLLPPLVTDSYMQATRVAILSIYKLAYEDRLRAEIPPDRWLSQVSLLFCEAIREGLKDAGRSSGN